MKLLFRRLALCLVAPILLVVCVRAAGALFLTPERDQARIRDLAAIRAALSSYDTYHHSFPRTDGLEFGRAWSVGGITYMEKVPLDPLKGRPFPYCYNNYGDIYILCAQMENNRRYPCPRGTSDGVLCGTCIPGGGSSLSYNYCFYGTE